MTQKLMYVCMYVPDLREIPFNLLPLICWSKGEHTSVPVKFGVTTGDPY